MIIVSLLLSSSILLLSLSLLGPTVERSAAGEGRPTRKADDADKVREGRREGGEDAEREGWAGISSDSNPEQTRLGCAGVTTLAGSKLPSLHLTEPQIPRSSASNAPVQWLGVMPRLVSKSLSSRAVRYIHCRPSPSPTVNVYNMPARRV